MRDLCPPPSPLKAVSSPLGQRAHELRVVADEGWVDALLLQEFAHQLVQQARGRLRRRAVDVVLGAQVNEHLPRLLALQVRRQLGPEALFQPRNLMDRGRARCASKSVVTTNPTKSPDTSDPWIRGTVVGHSPKVPPAVMPEGRCPTRVRSLAHSSRRSSSPSKMMKDSPLCLTVRVFSLLVFHTSLVPIAPFPSRQQVLPFSPLSRAGAH
jgi:hypothetical protein